MVLAALAAVLAVAVGSELFESRSGADAPLVAHDRQSALPVEVVRVKRQEAFDTARLYPGRVEAARTSDLGFERGGQLAEVGVEEGSRVGKGDILARLDDSLLRARRDELRAGLDAAQALLQELVTGPRREDIEAAAAQSEDIEEQLDLARLQLARARQLLDRNAVSQEIVDRRATEVRSLESRLKAADSRLQALRRGTRSEKIAAQRAEVERTRSALSRVEVEIAKSRLRAPFPGRISLRLADEGTVLQAGSPVLRLVEDGRLQAHIGVPASTARQLRGRTQPLEVVVEGRGVQARLSSVAPDVDLETRTVAVILELGPARRRDLMPGQVAQLRIAGKASESGFTLPVSALLKGKRGLWACYVVREDEQGVPRAERRDVELLHSESQRVFVRGTLEDGEQVVKSGVHRLTDGQAVRLAP
ncbi:MAG TPA: efflux RND transporter periplasmic adaptor subunit [Acidobacteriota bacterium]|nr:efflux RND transporter periplasmic adaptor subunit [Acidobacteriota bacterium]